MYARVFSQILDSSLLESSVEARWLFVAMLVIADEARTGVVDMPASRLAARVGLTMDQLESALAELSAPDLNSSSPAEEGRRIMRMDRGWLIVNWDKYREVANAEQRRRQVREAVARFRGKRRHVIKGNHPVSVVKASGNPSAATATTTPEAVLFGPPPAPALRTGSPPPGGRPRNGSKPRGRFVPPKLSEVVAFVEEKNLPVDPEKFVTYYRSNGWRVGRNPMVDWRSAVHTWARKDA